VDQLQTIELAFSEWLLSSSADADADAQPPQDCAAELPSSPLNRIRRHMESRLSDPQLTPDAVATHVGVSIRSLQKLFESSADTFTHYLRRRRLARCRADLANPLMVHLSISNLCTRWGFSDAAHFSRAFREQYGLSPRGYRQQISAALSQRVWQRAADTAVDPAPAARAEWMQISGAQHHQLPLDAQVLNGSPAGALEVASGDIVTIETVSRSARSDYERMIEGDAALERALRAAPAGRLLTGPIALRGAQPGNVVEVRVLDTRLRTSLHPRSRGQAFGCSVDQETKRVNRFDLDPVGDCATLRALQRVQMPLRPHFGAIMLGKTGETIDDPALGRGASLYLPVQAANALLWVGDPRAAARIDCSLTGVFQLILHRRSALCCPLLESSDEWVVSMQAHDAMALERASVAIRQRMVRALTALPGLSESESRSVVDVGLEVTIVRAADHWRIRGAVRKNSLAAIHGAGTPRSLRSS
jgi:AraC-like DNA-binding protein/acetamidase/formamidase